MPPKARITCHKGELDSKYSKWLDPAARDAESQQYYLIFIHGNAIPHVFLSIIRAAPRLATYLLWAYWLHKRISFINPAIEGLNGIKLSYCWRNSLLFIIPATEGSSSKKPSYRWRYSLLSIIPATGGLSSRKPSYRWRYSLLSIIPAIEMIFFFNFLIFLYKIKLRERQLATKIKIIFF